MNPLDALSNFALGLVRNHELQNWFRLVASIIISAVCTFLFVFGSALIAGYSQGYTPLWDLVLSIGTASTSTSVVVGFMWKTNPATKGIPFAFVEAEQDAEFKTNLGYDQNKK